MGDKLDSLRLTSPRAACQCIWALTGGWRGVLTQLETVCGSCVRFADDPCASGLGGQGSLLGWVLSLLWLGVLGLVRCPLQGLCLMAEGRVG